jgi:1-acyl-sn-glycerol-3-phosphate acyltransferase
VSVLETQLRYWTAFVVTSVASMLFFVALLFIFPWRQGRIRACNFFGKTVGRFNIWISGAQLRVAHFERVERSRPAIYISNHTSTLDIWMGMWICPYGGVGVAKKELVRVPFFGWLYWLSGHPLLDRSNKQRAIATLNELSLFVKKNKLSIWIWPEGTRSRSGELGAFKKGVVHMAIATGLPVVPVLVWGAQEIWPIRKVWALIFQKTPLDLEVMEPIDTSGWTAEAAGENAKALEDLVRMQLALGPPPGRAAS